MMSVFLSLLILYYNDDYKNHSDNDNDNAKKTYLISSP